jgi:DNA-directed RNA polymerase specialized sigma subunit
MTRQDRTEVSPKVVRAEGGAATLTPTTPSQARHGNVVSELIRELTRRERLVLTLRYTEELTVHEIAAVLMVLQGHRGKLDHKGLRVRVVD